MKKEQIKIQNINLLACAAIWYLNNSDKNGKLTTKMNIPNLVFITWEKKLAQLPKDRLITEKEALEIVNKK